MTPEQINAAIAEFHGWYKVHWNEDGLQDGLIACSLEGIPNYYGSLDAIVPVVREMDDTAMAQVIVELHRLSIEGQLFSCYVATPAQWCEAYLKSKGLWK